MKTETHTHIYIDPDKIYLRSHTSSMFLFQVIHQDNDHQGKVQKMQD